MNGQQKKAMKRWVKRNTPGCSWKAASLGVKSIEGMIKPGKRKLRAAKKR